MKKKLIVAAISSALVAPSAFAAQDDLGMNYTSAAEGFYGSIRALYRSGTGTKDSGSNLTSGSSSRLGVQGTNDLGGGLEGYYRVEFNVGDNDGDEVKNRLRYVGLRGGFGEIEVGSLWDDQYNFVTTISDLSPTNSGNFAPYFRIGSALQYRTPDLNGFQGSIRVTMKNVLDVAPPSADATKRADTDDDAVYDSGGVWYAGGNGDGKVEFDSDGNIAGVVSRTIAEDGSQREGEDRLDRKDENDLDSWSLSAKYAFQGFTIAGNYEHIADDIPAVTAFGGSRAYDGDGRADANALHQDGSTNDGMDGTPVTKDVEDRVFWAVGMSYGQDNWSVGGWYGERDARSGEGGADSSVEEGGAGDGTTAVNGGNGVIHDEAEEIMSIGASVDVDKVTLYGVYEVKDNVDGVAGKEDAHANVGVLYRIGSNTNTWVEYYSRDLDSSKTEDDIVIVGLRHNF